MRQTTLYRKDGKRYVKHDDYLYERGLPCGLYLFYKPNYNGEHRAMMDMIHYAKVHDIDNVACFSDIFVKHGKEIAETIMDHKHETADFIAKAIIAKISKL